MESIHDNKLLMPQNNDELVAYIKAGFEYMSIQKTTEPVESKEQTTLDFKITRLQLNKYQEMITSLQHKLSNVKLENINLHNKLKQINNQQLSEQYVNIIKEETNELKQLISIMKGEIHDIKNVLVGQPKERETTTISKEQLQKKCENQLQLKD